MDSGKYRTEYWDGREVMPGGSMRFVNFRATPRIVLQRLGGNYAPLFDRDRAGKIIKPRPHRPGDEDNSIGARLTGGDRKAEGKLRDELLKRTRQSKQPSRARAG